jgi:hypothetical protein
VTRRETTTHRVELVVPPTDADGAVQLADVLAAHAALERERPRDALPAVVRHIDGEVRVSYDVELTPGDPVRQLLERAVELRAALDVDGRKFTYWSELFAEVRRQREALDRLTGSDDPDGPVLALLPRDWPRQLDQVVLTDSGPKSRIQLLSLVKRRVDDWVLDALDRLGGSDQHDVLDVDAAGNRVVPSDVGSSP